MPQSLLVLLGVVLVSLLALQQVRAGHHTEAGLRQLSLEAAAADVAADRLAFLGSLPFDEAVKAGADTSRLSLTPFVGGQFRRLLAPDPPGDDLDDFDGARETVPVRLRDGAPPVPMTVETTVRYAAETDVTAPALLPTRFKRATVLVTAPGADTVRVSQLYSCGGFCPW